jgi:hypothetical protein
LPSPLLSSRAPVASVGPPPPLQSLCAPVARAWP